MVEIKKVEGWEKLLASYLWERRKMPFEWAKNDCMSNVAGWIKLATGHDFFPEFCNYHDEESALKILSENYGVVGILQKCLGPGSRDIMYAKRGNIAVAKMPEMTAGIIDDSAQWIAMVSKNGFVRVPVKKAWRIWEF